MVRLRVRDMKATCRVIRGKTGTEYSYSFGATNPEFEELYYYIDGGDNNYSSWLEPFSSGEQIHSQWICH